MKVKALVAFKSKFWKPWKKLGQVCLKKFRFRRPISIRGFGHRGAKKGVVRALSLWSSSSEKEIMINQDQVSELTSTRADKTLFPSPLTPAAYAVGKRGDANNDNEVEYACRSFEKYLMEMIVEDGKIKDMVEVEEFLYCWKNLRCPIFTALVYRFYGELCKDLFSSPSSG